MLTKNLSQSDPWMTSEEQQLTTIAYNLSNIEPAAKPACHLPVAFYICVNFIFVGVVCILGIIGNTLSAFVLHRERGNRVAVLLLQSLAVADNACLTLTLIYVPFIMGILPSLPEYSNTVRTVTVYFRRYVEPVAHMAQTGTIWTVVLLAANRYFAICRPLQAQSYQTMTRTKIQIATVVLSSVFFNMPRFFQTKIVTNPVTGYTELIATDIGPESKFDEIYTNALYTMLVLVLPFLLLLVLNICLILALRASRKRMLSNSVNRVEANENNITLVMVIIIVVFLSCLLPDRLIPVFIRVFDPLGCFLQVFMCICNLLFVVNSSVNFIIYYLFQRRFRNILLTRICGCQHAFDSYNSTDQSLRLRSVEYSQDVSFRQSKNYDEPCKYKGLQRQTLRSSNGVNN
ncbi:hypothetical protein CAPTEDRAFT_203648 [Capitella teleta]|uniref:G-protein coupled receptors family 1 profile domain-containing protein n=1 Tax=Capitella teleta TaxID=283909 RepID=R7TDG5_CAPTE|nr:hypothetical protein CAPTEDRAFT_203648 [Capitella teleta]|eukprot:ELT89532.1 hypothetical protein CAPTEDRAFT_203648 [Capitella teleta]